MTRQSGGLRRRAVWTGFALVALLAIACSRNKQQGEGEPYVPIEPIPIHVKNENFADMNVAVISGGTSRRLGQVTGNASADFKMNWSVANGRSVYFTATPIGGRGTYTSAGLTLRPGESVEFVVGSVLRQSTAVVREP